MRKIIGKLLDGLIWLIKPRLIPVKSKEEFDSYRWLGGSVIKNSYKTTKKAKADFQGSK